MLDARHMRSPQTSHMNDALANFIDFAEAWLCYPYCTQDELLWDINADDQINLIDWAAADANDLSGAFLTNGCYLLTDFRNSVIGKVNPDGGVDEISYDAWGTPYVSQGVDLEGLSILWNGYYFDNETGNYFLRNRYYSPPERRFLTQDPHGVNPDENWNNPFSIKDQYDDGCGLRVYAQGDPLNNRDDWGLWKYALPVAQRTKEGRTFVIANDVWEMKYNIKGLAQLVRLNEEQFDDWGKRAIREVNGIKKCGAMVANTAYVDKGDVSGALLGPIQTERINWLNLLISKELNDIEKHFQTLGYHTVRSNNVSRENMSAHLSNSNIIAWAFGGHGNRGVLVLPEENTYSAHDAENAIHHKLAEIILYACEAGHREPVEIRRGILSRWHNIKSKYGRLVAPESTFRAINTDWEDLQIDKKMKQECST